MLFENDEGREVELIDTGKLLWDGEVHQTVWLDPSGYFVVLKGDGGEHVRKDTLQALRVYFEDVVKRKEAKARRKPEAVKFEGTVLLTSEWGNRYDRDGTPTPVTIRGLSVDGNRVLVDGLPKGQRLDKYATVYRRFEPEDASTLTSLQDAVRFAEDQLKDFLEAREAGRASDVGKLVEQGQPVEVGG